MNAPGDPYPASDGVPARHAGCRLTVDLGALVANWMALAKVCEPAETAGVVKADAYGLGVGRVVPALVRAGCKSFFVALPHEGIAVRRLAPEARIFVLNPQIGEGSEADLVTNRLIPCLNSSNEIAAWGSFRSAGGDGYPCAINVDTGMNRLGLTLTEALSFASENALTRAIAPSLVMSHLACADEPAHPTNRRQLDAFRQVLAAFEGVESSLVNSAGVFLGRDWHHGLTRPGIAVYGGAPVAGVKNPMRAAVTAEARVAQVRYARVGETVSYGATHRLIRDTAIAVCAIGYADGYPRSSSGSGVRLRADGSPGGCGFIAGRRVPILGRVTMDLAMFDVTECGRGAVGRGDWIELFGPNIPLDEAAAAAGTISYELLTGLGRRYRREYVGGGA